MNIWLDDHIAAGLQETCLHKLKLFLNEAVENTIRYGCDGSGAAEILIELSVNGEATELTLTDNASQYDPTVQVAKPAATDLESLSIGGLGIQLMRDAASEMSYRFVDGRNILIASFKA